MNVGLKIGNVTLDFETNAYETVEEAVAAIVDDKVDFIRAAFANVEHLEDWNNLDEAEITALF